MLFYGEHKRNVCEVIKADPNFVFPGVEVMIDGGFGPKGWTEGIMKRDSDLYQPTVTCKPMFGQTLTLAKIGRLRRFKESVDHMHFDLKCTLESIGASRRFMHVPKPPDSNPRGPSAAPIQIQIPSVAAPDKPPRGPKPYPRYERVAVDQTVRTGSEGLSPIYPVEGSTIRLCGNG